MADKELLQFIKEARKRGFSDLEIRKPLFEKGWPTLEVDKAFLSLQPKIKYKNQVTLFLSNDIVNSLDKRAKKNMMTFSEQIEDILRRSCINIKTTTKTEKLDDTLISCFSRKQRKK